MPEQDPCGRAASANPLGCICLRPVAGTVDDPDVAGALQLRGHPDTGQEYMVGHAQLRALFGRVSQLDPGMLICVTEPWGAHVSNCRTHAAQSKAAERR